MYISLSSFAPSLLTGWMRQLLPKFPGNAQQWLDTMAADGEDGQLYFHPPKNKMGKKNWKGIGNGFQELETPGRIVNSRTCAHTF
jgi:hypothetical protein